MLNENEVGAASQNQAKLKKVTDYINSHLQKYENSTPPNNNICDSLETAEELTEGTITATDWKNLYDMLEDIPGCQNENSKEVRELKDKVLVNLVEDGLEMDCYKYIDLINEEKLRIDTIIHNLRKWPENICKEIITLEITKFGDTKTEELCELEKWLEHIELCEKVKDIMKLSVWSIAYDKCEQDKENVFLKLLCWNEIKCLVQFIKLHSPEEQILEKLLPKHLWKILDVSENYESINELLDLLPRYHAANICNNLIKQMRNLQHLDYIISWLLSKMPDEKLKSMRVSLKMLAEFPPNEQEQFFCLLPEPVDIIEVLIMNSKFDKLFIVLDILTSECLHSEFIDEKLSVEHIDEVLRSYAEKSLEFRVVTHPGPRLLRITKIFIMPEEVPNKDNWIPNNEVVECMCCRKITFSMFNRRHHCRRCGRVVCYSCSSHRMLVPTYEDVLVRVCSDCYHQTDLSDGSDNSSVKSIVYDVWLLTDDLEHNKIVREEFSYEEAPSVALCLSIMKHHSKNIEYPKFLLEQCNVMLQLLQPSQQPTKEIDYVLVIKMLKSIAYAAKMASQEGHLHYGTSLADNILSQADLLHLLAERGCLNLLPVQSNYAQNPYIDSFIVRKLRDRLLEEEQWNLALEVSTKTGLDNTGVFAAWGKACLKVGCLQLAREKFQRCLDKNGFYESFNDLSLRTDSYDTLQEFKSFSKSTTSLSSITSEAKPMKDPPLLKEIIHILEANSTTVHPDIIAQLEKRRASTSSISNPDHISLLNKLKNIKNISHGKQAYATQPTIHKVFYDESVYYLSKYGTHLTLLKFFIRHGYMNKALNYMIENHLGPDMFIDIYMWCLRDGIIEVLQAHMSAIDSNLDLWKEYLRHICRHLEKQKMLHALYQLQQFMGDYIRAAMTCIRFYQDGARNFTDLFDNEIQLHKAVEHLRHVLEQEQWIDVSPVKKSSSVSADDFEEKAIVNASLVMKMHPKNINRHITTISCQEDIVKFLAECEEHGKEPMKVLSEILPSEGESILSSQMCKLKVPTLFGCQTEKINLAVLTIVCGQTIEEGFEVALSIIQDFNVRPIKIYCEAGKQLAKAERYDAIIQLVGYIKEHGNDDQVITDTCDEILLSAVATFTKTHVSEIKVEDLIKLISDIGTKITAYTEAKLLKTAYVLAVKYKRKSHLWRIMKQAELTNQPSIKAICQKVLNPAHTPTCSKK